VGMADWRDKIASVREWEPNSFCLLPSDPTEFPRVRLGRLKADVAGVLALLLAIYIS
jgi:hypothetical protein